MGLVKPGQLVASAVFVILVLSGLSLFADARALSSVLRGFDWRLALPALGLTIVGYGARFARWQLYLRRLAIGPLETGTSALVFVSGFSMAVTPGKMGEVIKAVLLRRLTGTAAARGSAIVVAERVTDVAAMLVLASIGLFSFSYARPFLVVAAVVTTVAVLALQRPALLTSFLAKAERWPVIGPRLPQVTALLHASRDLLAPRPLAAGLALSVAAWACESAAFVVVLNGLGLAVSWHLALVATFVLAVSTLLGAASMLPGGLGVAEASVVGMLLLLLGDEMDRGTAAAAAILIRFATLWFGVLLGAVGVVILRRTRAWRGGAEPEDAGPVGVGRLYPRPGSTGEGRR